MCPGKILIKPKDTKVVDFLNDMPRPKEDLYLHSFYLGNFLNMMFLFRCDAQTIINCLAVASKFRDQHCRYLNILEENAKAAEEIVRGIANFEQ